MADRIFFRKSGHVTENTENTKMIRTKQTYAHARSAIHAENLEQSISAPKTRGLIGLTRIASLKLKHVILGERLQCVGLEWEDFR